jgi:hypothetical protein
MCFQERNCTNKTEIPGKFNRHFLLKIQCQQLRTWCAPFWHKDPNAAGPFVANNESEK